MPGISTSVANNQLEEVFCKIVDIVSESLTTDNQHQSAIAFEVMSEILPSFLERKIWEFWGKYSSTINKNASRLREAISS